MQPEIRKRSEELDHPARAFAGGMAVIDPNPPSEGNRAQRRARARDLAKGR
jgi:hypothetical protein